MGADRFYERMWQSPPPPPSAEEQLEAQAQKIRNFLAIDHASLRKQAERDLAAIELALNALRRGP